jgi:excisionase family DNA binding protein
MNHRPITHSITLSEAAVLLGISERAILEGALPAYMVHGQWRVPTTAVRVYAESQRDGLPIAPARHRVESTRSARVGHRQLA